MNLFLTPPYSGVSGACRIPGLWAFGLISSRSPLGKRRAHTSRWAVVTGLKHALNQPYLVMLFYPYCPKYDDLEYAGSLWAESWQVDTLHSGTWALGVLFKRALDSVPFQRSSDRGHLPPYMDADVKHVKRPEGLPTTPEVASCGRAVGLQAPNPRPAWQYDSRWMLPQNEGIGLKLVSK